MTEHDLIRLLTFMAGLTLSLIGVCRINALMGGRRLFRYAYIGVTVGAAGMVLGAVWPQHASDWHGVVLLVSVLALLWDTRSRWREGPPVDSGSSL